MELSLQSILFRFGRDLGYFSLTAIILTIAYCVVRAVSDPLRSIPGPFYARFTNFWYLKHVNKGTQQLQEIELHRKYGPIVRLAPNQYSFSDISATKAIYDHGAKFPKSDFYAPFGTPDAPRANIFQDQNIDAHAMKRRKIASLYSMTSILTYEPFVDSCMRTFLDQLDQFASESKIVDIPAWMQFYAFDVIGSMSVGEPFGFLEQGYDFPGIIAELHKGQTYASHMGAFAGSWHLTLAPIMMKITKNPPFLATQRYTETHITKKQIDLEHGKSVKEATGKQDFAEKLLSLKAEGKVNDIDLYGCIRANIAAGSDTTGLSLSAILYFLLRYPEVLAKLRREVDAHKSSQQDSTKFLTFAEAQEMPYLQAVIKEALRLHPAVGMQLPRYVPEGGAMLAGHFFPAGTVVGTNPNIIHHQTDLFGEDADQFRPDRWLEDEEKAKKMDRNLLTFGAGSRTCIGKNVSMLEMQKLVPELVSRYDFELANDGKEWELLNRMFIYIKYKCYVRVRGQAKQ